MNENDAFENYKKLFDNASIAAGYEAIFKDGYKAGVRDTQTNQYSKKETETKYDSLEIRRAYAAIKAEAMSRTELQQLARERIFVNSKYTLDSIMIDVIRNNNPNTLQYCEK